MLAVPSGKIGLLGILLLLAACVVTSVHGYLGRRDSPCAVPVAAAPPSAALQQDAFQIIGVNPEELPVLR